MAKVELGKIRLAVTAISNNVVVTIPSKDGRTMLHKHDVHSDFLKCIIDYGKNSRFNIAVEDGSEKEYQVAVVPKGKFKKALYTRKDILKLLEKSIIDGMGDEVSLDKWAELNLK